MISHLCSIYKVFGFIKLAVFIEETVVDAAQNFKIAD